MNKSKLIKKIASESGIKSRKCEKFADSFFGGISKKLTEERKILIDKFGEFGIFRTEIRVIHSKENLFMVIPPGEHIEFRYISSNENDFDFTSVEDIINNLSIDFTLSKSETEILVSKILSKIKNNLNGKKKFEYEKFGTFKVKTDKKKNEIVKFISSGKLYKKINYCFNDLKTQKVITAPPEVLSENEIISYEISEEFKSNIKEENQDSPIGIQKKTNEKSKSETSKESMRKLISEEVLKLHNEITKPDKISGEVNDDGLWG